MVGNAATVLHRDHVAHLVVHVEEQVEQGRLQVGGWHSVSDAQLAQLAKQDLEADHSLRKVGPIEGVDAVGASHSTLDLDSAHVDISYGLA